MSDDRPKKNPFEIDLDEFLYKYRPLAPWSPPPYLMYEGPMDSVRRPSKGNRVPCTGRDCVMCTIDKERAAKKAAAHMAGAMGLPPVMAAAATTPPATIVQTLCYVRSRFSGRPCRRTQGHPGSHYCASGRFDNGEELQPGALPTAPGTTYNKGRITYPSDYVDGPDDPAFNAAPGAATLPVAATASATPAAICAVRSGYSGRPCRRTQGHTGSHYTACGLFTDPEALPPGASPKNPKAPKRTAALFNPPSDYIHGSDAAYGYPDDELVGSTRCPAISKQTGLPCQKDAGHSGSHMGDWGGFQEVLGPGEQPTNPIKATADPRTITVPRKRAKRECYMCARSDKHVTMVREDPDLCESCAATLGDSRPDEEKTDP